jgi:hypothetical protein
MSTSALGVWEHHGFVGGLLPNAYAELTWGFLSVSVFNCGASCGDVLEAGSGFGVSMFGTGELSWLFAFGLSLLSSTLTLSMTECGGSCPMFKSLDSKGTALRLTVTVLSFPYC